MQKVNLDTVKLEEKETIKAYRLKYMPNNYCIIEE